MLCPPTISSFHRTSDEIFPVEVNVLPSVDVHAGDVGRSPGRYWITSKRSPVERTAREAFGSVDAPGRLPRVQDAPVAENQTAGLMCWPPPQPPSPRTPPRTTNPESKLATWSRTSVPLDTVGSGRAVQAVASGEVQSIGVEVVPFAPKAMYPALPPEMAWTLLDVKVFGIGTRLHVCPSGELHIA